ncbi:Uncharacterised protein [Mycobacteroides abscessus subsp. abscessus]|nr:Uncharacterised protein [Mycobacteroides abscessus subsp. abscessus]SKT34406.1 Uncharacterised protein [Mycobacteroides abscessus subsp. abscessus]
MTTTSSAQPFANADSTSTGNRHQVSSRDAGMT